MLSLTFMVKKKVEIAKLPKIPSCNSILGESFGIFLGVFDLDVKLTFAESSCLLMSGRPWLAQLFLLPLGRGSARSM